MRRQTTIFIWSLTVWLSAFVQGEPIQKTTTNGINSRRRYRRRRASVIELEQNGAGKKGGKGQTSKDLDVKGTKKGAKGEQDLNDNEDSFDHSDSEDAVHDDGSSVDGDFYGMQTPPPSKQYSHSSSSNLSALSNTSTGRTAKSSKKVKKNKSGDSHKNSSKLSKKSSTTSSRSPVVSPPTVSPGTPTGAPTPAPSSTSSLTRHLSPYGIEYAVTEDDRIPFRSELLEVVELTKEYLHLFFDDEFEGQADAVLDEFQTVFTDTESNFGDSIYIAYKSSAIFDPSSSSIPTSQELDGKLTDAFEGQNLDGYLGMLQALPPSNLFSTSTFVTITEVRENTRIGSTTERTGGPRHRARTSGSTGTAGIAAGVTGLTLMAAAGLIHRRKVGPAGTSRNLKNSDSETTTVTTGTWSLDRAALQGYNEGIR